MRASRALEAWCAARSPAALRTAFGLLLALHFVQHTLHTSALIGSHGLWSPEDGAVSAAATQLRQWSPELLRGLFGVGAGIAVLLALGIAVLPLSLLLYALSALTYQATFPAVTLDDQVARPLALMLMLSAASRARGWFHPRVALSLWLLGTYLALALTALYTRGDGAFVLAATALGACLLLGHRVAAWAGLLAVLYAGRALHVRFESVVFSGALIAGYLLWLLRQRERPALAKRRAPRLDLAGALALGVAVVHGLGSVAHWAGVAPAETAAQRVLLLLGLAPQRVTATASAYELRAVLEAEGGASATQLGPGDLRYQAALRLLASEPSTAELSSLRLGAARALVRQRCDAGARGPGRLRIAATGGASAQEPSTIAWFDCRADEPAAVVLLRDHEHPNMPATPSLSTRTIEAPPYSGNAAGRGVHKPKGDEI